MWLGIIELIKKILDFVTPWSTYWVERRKKKNQAKEDAERRMNEADNGDDYWDAWSDKRNA